MTEGRTPSKKKKKRKHSSPSTNDTECEWSVASTTTCPGFPSLTSNTASVVINDNNSQNVARQEASNLSNVDAGGFKFVEKGEKREKIKI